VHERYRKDIEEASWGIIMVTWYEEPWRMGEGKMRGRGDEGRE
jgi:hypothetical protein